MRLLLIALSCLAVSLALPKPKEKRGLLLADSNYGTSQHHLENVVAGARVAHGYVQSVPDVVHNAYGPPEYEPGVPLGNEYLPPVGLIKVSTPVPTYAASDAVYVPGVQKTYVTPEVAQTVSSTTVSVPVEETKTFTVTPPSTSYGVPVTETVKNSVETGVNSHVKSTVKTVKTEIHEEEQNVPSPVVNVVHQAPAVDDVARFASGVKTVPAVTTTVTKNVVGNVPLTGGLSSVYDSYARDFNVYSYPSHPSYTSYSSYPSYTSYSSYPSYTSYSSYPSYSSYSSYPSSLYSNLQHSTGLNSFDTLSTGYSRLGLSAPLSYQVPVYGTKTFGAAYSFPHTVQVPEVSSQQPYTLTHAVSRVQEPLQTLSLPSVSPVSTHLPLQTLTPVSQVHTVQSVKSVNTPVQHTVHTVQPVPAVKYTKTVTPVQHTVETVTPTHPVHSEDAAVHSQQTVKTASTVHPVKSVEILTPPLQPTESCHTVTKVVKTQTVPVNGEYVHTQKGFLDDIGHLFNPFTPFLPLFTGTSASASTEAPSEGVFLSSTPLPTAVVKESASVSNPVLVNAQVVSSTVAPFESVQPTHANGGYVY
ncbi:unnamed protein product [Xylocopa violacea]|uniref:Uncharacterized protein n=1 Tax=Xylocopa violacea TaxID=135666 RepID=A0ABP1NIW9_XYLVO